jgi:hypothetical protein
MSTLGSGELATDRETFVEAYSVEWESRKR